MDKYDAFFKVAIDPTIDFPPNFFYKEEYIIEVKYEIKRGVTVVVFDLRGWS
jgi:hypothetical protein